MKGERSAYLSNMSLDIPCSSSRLALIRNGAVVVLDNPAIFQVQGTGALTCLQGLFTCDLAEAGVDSLSWGALLSAKGMILFDAWAIREAGGFTLVTEASARGLALELFRRTLPPRLAKLTDWSESHRVAWLLGRSSTDRLDTPPEPGRISRIGAEGESILARGAPQAPFGYFGVGPADSIAEWRDSLRDGGVTQGTEDDFAAAKVLAGWPTLGREIDDKTLPQEVRFDELGGVSYTKGCYTGQETVARIHFRGHVNRTLRGVLMDAGTPPGNRVIRAGEKEVGTLRSALVLEDRVLALAMIRREIDREPRLAADGRSVRIMTLPLAESESN